MSLTKCNKYIFVAEWGKYCCRSHQFYGIR